MLLAAAQFLRHETNPPRIIQSFQSGLLLTGTHFLHQVSIRGLTASNNYIGNRRQPNSLFYKYFHNMY